MELEKWQSELKQLLQEFMEQVRLQPGSVVVIGCSTSEVIGKHIGKAGTSEVAKIIFTELKKWQEEHHLELAFQCCEHLNRALVVEQETAQARGLEQVSVVPVPAAGGAMASYAYRNMKQAAMVEFIKADAGIDIGDTFIGMHLKHVAVPVRVSLKEIGSAHVTLAFSRPKLIGGARAVYTLEAENQSC